MGGFPIYKGDPVEAVIYFKKRINHVNADESECEYCGNVNPEQIFNIIDMKVVDEYGLQTGKRKVDPQEWNEYYHKLIQPKSGENTKQDIPKSIFKIPNVISQMGIFFKRDLKSKLTCRSKIGFKGTFKIIFKIIKQELKLTRNSSYARHANIINRT